MSAVMWSDGVLVTRLWGPREVMRILAVRMNYDRQMLVRQRLELMSTGMNYELRALAPELVFDESVTDIAVCNCNHAPRELNNPETVAVALPRFQAISATHMTHYAAPRMICYPTAPKYIRIMCTIVDDSSTNRASLWETDLRDFDELEAALPMGLRLPPTDT